ncbi:Ethyl tert-butyl ether degradation [Fusarium agapanthi]|uniref:Ethyl tert-butyl ether degradation n=1 Tax=Fusarium agapanthi TaxID=1803897 RepID=A0A9P5E5L1_9HYPO|nr:Ethyl tert-butyl ether degradation [Fusarium agapanthi]
MATVVIQYPAGHDFDVDYYVNTHMPLAHKLWGPLGLVSGQVIKLGGDSPYQIYTIITWDSMASFQKASVSEEAKQIKDDVKNFTTATATYVIGETVAKV